MPISYPDDVLGDGFANALLAVWERMKAREPELCSQRGAYSLWQWAMCRACGHQSRIVASPQAMAIAHRANGEAGQPYPGEEDFRRLMALGQTIAEEETIEV